MAETRTASIEQLLRQVRLLYGAMDRFDARCGAALGVDPTAVRAINALEDGPVSPGELGERLGLSSGSVTAMLDRLERAGLVERRASALDGRRRDASLTRQAFRRASRHFGALGRAIEAAFQRRRADELALAIAVVGDLARAFDDAGAERD